jgi:hypothetical protein
MVMSNGHMLTTVDNPYSPVTDFDRWNAWDMAAGYHTLSLLARIIVTSNDLSDADRDQDYERAVDEIVKENVSGMHTKVAIDSAAA